jgi:hypothetical protein
VRQGAQAGQLGVAAGIQEPALGGMVGGATVVTGGCRMMAATGPVAMVLQQERRANAASAPTILAIQPTNAA